MLVSVIIPCYNVEQYIRECVASVLAQTYSDIEIICVDNNSTDGTVAILNQLATEYPNQIKVASEFKKGASNARNKGIEISKGEWIQFLDADDIILPEKIELQLAKCISSDIDLVIGAFAWKKDAEKEINPIHHPWIGLIKGRLGYTCSNLWKKSMLVKVGGWDDVKSSQESYLMFKFLKNKAILVFDDACNTVKIESNEQSISNTNKVANWERYIDLRVLIYEYLTQNKFLSKEIEEALKINIFESIRILYENDKQAGLNYYKKHVKGKFKPLVAMNTTKLYLLLYTVFGFVLAQRIKAIVK